MKLNLLLVIILMPLAQLLIAQKCETYQKISFDDSTVIGEQSTIAILDSNWVLDRPSRHNFAQIESNDFALIAKKRNSSDFSVSEAIVKIPSYYVKGFGYFGLFSFDMQIGTSSKNEFASIEVSASKDTTWYKIIDTTSYGFIWRTSEPVMFGSQPRRTYCCGIDQFPYLLNMTNDDTLFFRFRFYQDSIQDNFKGVLFDNIGLSENLTGLNEYLFNEAEISLFPNPVNKELNVDISIDYEGFGFLQIFNTYGQLVRNEKFDGSTTNIDVSSLPNGSYYLIVRGEQTQIQSKFVKN